MSRTRKREVDSMWNRSSNRWKLRTDGWTLTGQFLEIYNEEFWDLLATKKTRKGCDGRVRQTRRKRSWRIVVWNSTQLNRSGFDAVARIDRSHRLKWLPWVPDPLHCVESSRCTQGTQHRVERFASLGGSCGIRASEPKQGTRKESSWDEKHQQKFELSCRCVYGIERETIARTLS